MRSVILQNPALDVEQLVVTARQLVDRRVSEHVDQCKRQMSDQERFLACLANFRDEKYTEARWTDDLLNHIQLTILTAGDPWTLFDFRDFCDHMLVTSIEVENGPLILVTTGGLADWRRCIQNAIECDDELIKNGAADLKAQFAKHKLGNLWN